jgi:peptidoglycan/xylan/chitin deacetylase (PgdA/CDA1 family)
MINKIIHRVKRAYRAQAAILTYHRIGYTQCDPWQLVVSPECFEQQLQVLRKEWNVITLDNLVQQIKEKRLKHRSVAITFDDGYIDNYQIAQHLLKKYKLPATFYIPSQSLNTHDEYWWDELENIFLNTQTFPSTTLSSLFDNLDNYDLTNEKELTPEIFGKHKAWNGSVDPPTTRASLYIKLWPILKALSQEERAKALISLRQWAGLISQTQRPDYLTMNLTQAQELAAEDLFTIGGHTSTHPSIPTLSIDGQKQELEESKRQLELSLKETIRHFAYPFGDFSDVTENILRECGYESAVTTQFTTINNKSNIFALGRFQVNNWDAKEFQRNLDQWMKHN